MLEGLVHIQTLNIKKKPDNSVSVIASNAREILQQ